MSMEKVAGYSEQSKKKVKQVNFHKTLEERLLRVVEKLEKHRLRRAHRPTLAAHRRDALPGRVHGAQSLSLPARAVV